MTPEDEEAFRTHLAAPLPHGHDRPREKQTDDLPKMLRGHAMKHAVGTVSHGHDRQQQAFIDRCKCNPPAQHKTCRDADTISDDCPWHAGVFTRRHT